MSYHNNEEYEENSITKEEDNYNNYNNRSYNYPMTFNDRINQNSENKKEQNYKINDSLNSSPRLNEIKSIESINLTSGRLDTNRNKNRETDQIFYSTEENKMRLQLMEKDKIIFEYSKALKETERVLDHTKKLYAAKEEIIFKLKDESKDLKFKIKNSENLLRHKEGENEKYKNYSEEKIILLNKEKSGLEDKLNELTNLFERNQTDFQNTLIEYKKIEKTMVKLKQNFSEKNEVLSNYEKNMDLIKKENKIIPTLKKQISDLENFMGDLKSEVHNEKSKCNRIVIEKEEMERKLREYIEDNKNDKEMANKAIKLTYEIDSIKKEYEEKLREINNLNEKYKNVCKDNDNFVGMITNEIAQFTNLLDNLANHKGVIKSNFSNNLQFNQNKNINNQFSLKYELINKNFEILKNKIIDNYNNGITCIAKLDRNLLEMEKYNKEIINEKDSLIKEYTHNKQKLSETIEIRDDVNTKLNKINEDYNNLKQIYVKAKTENEDLNKKNESICNEIQNFLKTLNDKLKEKFPEISEENNFNLNTNSNYFDLSFSEKILYYLDVLINEYNKMIKNERELLENCKMSQIQLKNSEDEKELLKTRVERILINKEDDLKQADLLKSGELKRQREILYEKISSLTSLLEESNHMITLYENENKDLKEKIGKLEFNLKMLTNSHLELENSISGNYATINLENDDKEMKYNHLLRELELRSIHIESIENLLQRKEDEIEKLSTEIITMQRKSQDENFRSTFGSKQIETEENLRSSNQNDDTSRFKNNYSGTNNMDTIDQNYKNFQKVNLMTNSNSSNFIPNEENENELRKLISNYNQENENDLNNSNVRYGIISSVNKSKRIPGKIYSVKKYI